MERKIHDSVDFNTVWYNTDRFEHYMGSLGGQKLRSEKGYQRWHIKPYDVRLEYRVIHYSQPHVDRVQITLIGEAGNIGRLARAIKRVEKKIQEK